jgi:glycosyltransferase involved in cell wall biosynthesis
MGVGAGLRVFPEVRAAHIDEIDASSPRRTLYFRTNYDLKGRTIPEHWERVGRLDAIRAVWRSDATSLELFEPLWLEFLSAWMLLAVTYKLRRRREAGVIGVFAIENNPVTDVAKGPRVLWPLVGHITRGVLKIAMRLIDRIAYGTESAEVLYQELGMRQGVEARVTHDLLSRRAPVVDEKNARTAAFVGALHPRKGLDVILKVWPDVERALPDAHLVVIGDGPLREAVEAWAAERPGSREFAGAVDHACVIEILSRVTVLVAPSRRYGRWREQVGRPIQEALAVGATVVTTTETGLAPWLQSHDHRVMEVAHIERDLAAMTIAALDAPLSPAQVRGSLPAVDGRLAADAWLHGGS